MLNQPLHEFIGDPPSGEDGRSTRPPLHLAIANGFPPVTYTPFVQPLLECHRVFTLPPRALWPGIGEPPTQPGTWVTLAEDLLTGLKTHTRGPVIGVGHSYGGVATLLAAVREPERFQKLVFLDPTILPVPVMAQIAELRRKGEPARFDLVEGARRRRSRFSSVEEAYAFWRSRTLFELWPDSTLRLYAASMTRPAADGDGVELTWTGAWEAYYYESFYAETWVEAARLSAEIPLLVLTGGTSTTVVPEAVEEMRQVWPWAEIKTIPGHGHLFPQEMGAGAGETVAEWLRRRP
ncbi:MAG TPA: alpha/beta hydrolase [Gemmatimonadales bacterium]|nr:alpha/beta hydrolase [Gemmatimonadales bacterium]